MPPIPMHRYATVGSTQDEAAQLLASGTSAPFAVLTRDQRQGRGRLGRVWQTSPSSGLALTLAHRSTLTADRRGWYSCVAGLATLTAIGRIMDRTAGQMDRTAVGLKWPNDVLADGRKLAGILVQSHGADEVLVGVGTNLTGPVRDAAGADVPQAGWLLGPGGQREWTGADATEEIDGIADHYAHVLAEALEAELALLDSHAGDALSSGQSKRYRMACVTLGRPVRIAPLGEPTPPVGGPGPQDARPTGIARSIDGAGRLVVEEADGRTRAIDVGDVRHLRATDDVAREHGEQQERHW